MAIDKIASAGSSTAIPALSANEGEKFGAVLKASSGSKGFAETAPLSIQPGSAAETSQSPSSARTVGSSDRAQRCPGVGPVGSTSDAGVRSSSDAVAVLDRVTGAQQRLDSLLKLAESGKTFSPAELLAMQAHVYRASQELDLAGKVVEKATAGVKQILQTQL